MYDVRKEEIILIVYDICTVFFRFNYVFETYHSN